MVRYCVLCNNKCNKSKGISLHSFPLERPDVLKKWADACGLSLKTDDLSKIWLCSCHFLESDFSPGSHSSRLKLNAVPSVGMYDLFDEDDCPTAIETFARKRAHYSSNIESFSSTVDDNHNEENIIEVVIDNSQPGSFSTSKRRTKTEPKQLLKTENSLTTIETFARKGAHDSPNESYCSTQVDDNHNEEKIFEVVIDNSQPGSFSTSKRHSKFEPKLPLKTENLFDEENNPTNIKNFARKGGHFESYSSTQVDDFHNEENITEVVIDSSQPEPKQRSEIENLDVRGNVDHNSESGLSSTPKMRRFAEPRYISEIQTSDVATPRQARRVLRMVKSRFHKKSQAILSLQKKVHRQKKKIESLINIVQHLTKNRKMSAAADNLTNLLPDCIKNVLIQKLRGTVQYSPEFRTFAMTLHFYSPEAYKYVRQKWNNLLPGISTIRKWTSSIKSAPGFTENGNTAFDGLNIVTISSRIPRRGESFDPRKGDHEVPSELKDHDYLPSS